MVRTETLLIDTDCHPKVAVERLKNNTNHRLKHLESEGYQILSATPVATATPVDPTISSLMVMITYESSEANETRLRTETLARQKEIALANARLKWELGDWSHWFGNYPPEVDDYLVLEAAKLGHLLKRT